MSTEKAFEQTDVQILGPDGRIYTPENEKSSRAEGFMQRMGGIIGGTPVVGRAVTGISMFIATMSSGCIPEQIQQESEVVGAKKAGTKYTVEKLALSEASAEVPLTAADLTKITTPEAMKGTLFGDSNPEFIEIGGQSGLMISKQATKEAPGGIHFKLITSEADVETGTFTKVKGLETIGSYFSMTACDDKIYINSTSGVIVGDLSLDADNCLQVSNLKTFNIAGNAMKAMKIDGVPYLLISISSDSAIYKKKITPDMSEPNEPIINLKPDPSEIVTSFVPACYGGMCFIPRLVSNGTYRIYWAKANTMSETLSALETTQTQAGKLNTYTPGTMGDTVEITIKRYGNYIYFALTKRYSGPSTPTRISLAKLAVPVIPPSTDATGSDAQGSDVPPSADANDAGTVPETNPPVEPDLDAGSQPDAIPPTDATDDVPPIPADAIPPADSIPGTDTNTPDAVTVPDATETTQPTDVVGPDETVIIEIAPEDIIADIEADAGSQTETKDATADAQTDETGIPVDTNPPTGDTSHDCPDGTSDPDTQAKDTADASEQDLGAKLDTNSEDTSAKPDNGNQTADANQPSDDTGNPSADSNGQGADTLPKPDTAQVEPPISKPQSEGGGICSTTTRPANDAEALAMLGIASLAGAIMLTRRRIRNLRTK